ncbi:hypothetical protein BDZ85DRAFT_280285 [Elsinoe ampelina]|uniref:Uncharacterized protein n=1 Tax=Elsinoe ampelina TaxID=302913 RepID=A0A6A6GH88_9PEZI|nr:hypothetical protein BDZ85DRAFT_280285 [Elsinoe ampelina]
MPFVSNLQHLQDNVSFNEEQYTGLCGHQYIEDCSLDGNTHYYLYNNSRTVYLIIHVTDLNIGSIYYLAHNSTDHRFYYDIYYHKSYHDISYHNSYHDIYNPQSYHDIYYHKSYHDIYNHQSYHDIYYHKSYHNVNDNWTDYDLYNH